MKAKNKKIISVLSTLALIISSVTFIVPISAAGSGSKVILAVEAFSADYGFVYRPTEVAIEAGDTGATILNKALGNSLLNDGSGVSSNVTSVALDTDFCSLTADSSYLLSEDDIEEKDEFKKEGWLSNGDFAEGSQWIFILNNSVQKTDLSSYVPVSGDVIRISFSVYKAGTDLGYGNAEDIPKTNRDALYKKVAEIYSPYPSAELDPIVDVAIYQDTEQEDLDLAIEWLSDPDFEPDLGLEEAPPPAVTTTTAKSNESDFIEDTTPAPAVTTAPPQKEPSLTTTAAPITIIPDKGTSADSADTGIEINAGFIIGAVILSGLALITFKKKKARKT